MFSYYRDNPLVPDDFLQTLPTFSFAPGDRVSLVVPHPDDETLACAGLVQRLSAAQIPLQIVMATDGNKHGKKVRRKAEVLASMARCGVQEKQFVFLDYPDGKLSAQPDLATKLQDTLQAFKPSVVVVTHPLDTHPDHAILGQKMQELQVQLPSVKEIFGVLIHYHRFPRPLGLKPTAPLSPPGRLVTPQQPWLTLPLSEAEQTVKKAAIGEFKSQLLTPFLRGLMLSFNRPNELYQRLG